jgi:protein-L-isoaspartate(D-aspartate) O-methyltransferase
LSFLFHRDHSTGDFSQQRTRMIDDQLRARGIRDERVLKAMAKVPREAFVEHADRAQAYGDFPLPIGAGQTISQPYMVAAMVEILDVKSSDRVLEVGTGTGYEAAVLGELAGEVWSIERHIELANKARDILEGLGCTNIHVLHGDGTRGIPEEAPFDKILVAAGAPRLPEALVAQLAVGGRLVVPVGSRHEQQLQLVRKSADQLTTNLHELCRFVPLVGEAGWEE